MSKNIHYPGSGIRNFRMSVETVMRLLQEINPNYFLSPYSLIPVISQIMGLNTPLMGSGDSIYSIVSVIFKIQSQKKLFQKLFFLSLKEKRAIVDEIYEMIAPFLLDEEDDYIELVTEVKYRKELKNTNNKVKTFFRRILKEKFAIIAPFVNRFLTRRGDFGYIVHYGYEEDLYREFNFLHKLPSSYAASWRKGSYPVVNEIIVKNFPAPRGMKKKHIKGWIIFITNYTKELLLDSRLRKRKIPQAVLLAQKLGAKLIGMGGLVASFAQGGYELSRMFPKVGFTTGHAYTIGNIIEIAKNISNHIELNIKKSTVAVVGAAGSIGSGCAKLLAESHPKRIILLDLSTFNAQTKLNELTDYIKKISGDIEVTVSFSFSDLKKADLIIVATNSPTSIIEAKYLKRGAVIIDDSFPKNISENVLKKRKDIIILEGGIMKLPLSIDISWARNMPDLMDVAVTRVASCKETYGCLAEALVLSLYQQRKNYGLGYADVNLAKDILTKAKRIGFSLAPLQCFDEAVEEERIKRVRQIVKRRQK